MLAWMFIKSPVILFASSTDPPFGTDLRALSRRVSEFVMRDMCFSIGGCPPDPLGAFVGGGADPEPPETFPGSSPLAGAGPSGPVPGGGPQLCGDAETVDVLKKKSMGMKRKRIMGWNNEERGFSSHSCLHLILVPSVANTLDGDCGLRRINLFRVLHEGRKMCTS